MNREQIIEVMARAMLADELKANKPLRDFDETWADERLIWISNATAALLALEAAGQRVVPAKPSDAMWDEGRDIMPNGQSYYQFSTDEIGELVFDVWDAMLSAAPGAQP